MADGSPPKVGSTRWIETSRGVLSFSELAPLLAERVLVVQRSIEKEEYASRSLDEELLREFHHRLCGDLVPDWSGKWRTVSVTVGTHAPPPPHRIAQEIRDYLLNFAEQLISSHEQDFPRTLAFAEGRLLTIHPFADFNGRVTRLWLWEILRRLDLSVRSLIPTSISDTQTYIAALRSADSLDFGPLERIWVNRFTDDLEKSSDA
jgi:CRISPR-associated endonuclease/helicase Cas3